MSLNRDDYIRRRLSKIQHKSWELFVITRIIHGLDDFDIEFICQQAVRRRGARPYLVDLYFPQFGVTLEIDERQHANEKNQIADASRSQDILDATGFREFRIPSYDAEKNIRSLEQVREDTDAFIGLIKEEKLRQIERGTFEPWNYDEKFSPAPHIARGYLSIETNPVFRTQLDALRCLGFTGKAYQRASWTLSSDRSRCVWFPWLYERSDWKNSISEDGEIIVEMRKNADGTHPEIDYAETGQERIVFAKHHDDLGARIYKFVGLFRPSLDERTPTRRVFRRVATRVEVVKPE